MRYYFEWDTRKAKKNFKKHNVSFESAATIFLDPRAITIFDSEHSESENRWITLGINNAGDLLVAVHTFNQINKITSKIRIISARKATKRESKQYEEKNL